MREALPPYDQDAEEAVLGSILIDNEAYDKIDLEPSDFFSEQNQIVFTAMKKLKEASNQITVAHELMNTAKLDEIGGSAYLSHLVAGCPTSLHIVYYASIVSKCSFNRRMISVAGQIEAIGYRNGEPEDGYAQVHNLIKNLAAPMKDDSILTPDDVAGDAWAYYENEDDISYIPTGIPSFDRKKGGYIKGEYVLICARTTVGKTTLALQEASFTAETIPTAFFSLEMNKQQVMNKNVSRVTGISEDVISLKKYRDHQADSKEQRQEKKDQRESIRAAVAQLAKLKLYIIEGNQTTDSIRRKINKMIDTVGCGIVFIDYLHLIRDRLAKDEHLRIGYISKEIASMAKEYKIPFVVLHQLNRDIEYRKGDNKQPQLSDLREGGEEDADLIIMPVRDPTNEHNVLCYIPKDRLRGRPGLIELNWHKNEWKYS